MRSLCLRRRPLSTVSAVVALTVTIMLLGPPASAAPEITSSLAPQSGPTSGGSPVRIYGTGFTNASDVKFGNVDATDFAVIDDTLITAVVPAASGGGGANNSFVDVKVTVAANTHTEVDGFYYTNATFTVTGNGTTSPFDDGDAITTTLGGYLPNTAVVVPQFNPLLVYVEEFPNFPFGPPPYAEILHFAPTTDSNGDLVDNVILADPFEGDDSYDSNVACPVNQTTANFLGNSDSVSLNEPAFSGHCMVANGQYGTGTLERAIDMTSDPTPDAPTLVPNASSVSRDSPVGVTGINWNANPFFGSSRWASKPGETAVTIQICDSATSTCSSQVGHVAVDMTRYIYNASTSVFDFSGANLHGGIVAGTDLPSPCTTCFIRVTQNRPAGGSIVQEASIDIN